MLTTATIDGLDGTDIVTLVIEGGFSSHELTSARSAIAAAAAAAGADGDARVLLDVCDLTFGKVTPEAMWEDLRSARLLKDVERAAVITDSAPLKSAISASGATTSLTAEAFEPAALKEALDWLRS